MRRFLLVLSTLLVTLLTAGEPVAAGNGRFVYQQAGKVVPVWYFVPQSANGETPILFVMHGVNRDAERYLNDWVPLAEKYKFVVIAPEFTRKDFPKDADYSQGAVFDENGQPRPREQTTFSFIEPIFNQLRTVIGNRTERYQLYGHSAGAQFAHRFLYFVPDARVTKVVAANAGWWTLPDTNIDYPYGLKNVPGVSKASLSALLPCPLIVLLGTNDIDPNDKNLNRSEGAMRQGKHRFERGNFYYQYGQRQAKAFGVQFGWTLATAPGVGHSDKGMSTFAAKLLFDAN